MDRAEGDVQGDVPQIVSRRDVLRAGLALTAAATLPPVGLRGETAAAAKPLDEVRYTQVEVRGDPQRAQFENVTAILMGLDENSLLKPFRAMAGRDAPGASLGGWYEWKPDYNFHHDDAGLAPGSTFGQWTSALARLYAGSTFAGGTGRQGMAERAIRLHALLREAIDPKFFAQTRFAGYTYDKLVCGLMDGHRLLGDAAAFPTLDAVTAAAAPSLPGHAVNRDIQSKPGSDISWMWDETYTLPENLFLAAAAGAGEGYRRMAESYLDDASYFEPLSQGMDVLADKHAYSYVNALCSSAQAYLTGGSEKHLRAAKNGFAFLQQQSFATGGWGPDENLRKAGYDELYKSLNVSHNGFETPCGSYAHMKLTRYLLRATRDGHYGDSMERVMQNTVLGALPLQADGRSFYSQDYNAAGKRVYSVHRWPCCSGTLPQVVADYGINSYLMDGEGVWVNLYQASAVRWSAGPAQVALEQTGGYPEDELIRITVSSTQPTMFAMRLRIPEWAGNSTSLKVNGRGYPILQSQGFTAVRRLWRSGDVVELRLPMALRLEQIPSPGSAAHPETVALLWGPWVLFALRQPGETGNVSLSEDALLGAKRTGSREWAATYAGVSRRFVPFQEVGESGYSTYVTLV